LEKDMLPESKLCSERSEQLRRLLSVRRTLKRASVSVKNQIHALLVSMGMKDERASLQSKRGRQRVSDALERAGNELVVQPLFDTIEQLEAGVKRIEDELEKLCGHDRVIELLMTIPGCGKIGSWTIRAFTDDITRFSSAKKYSAYAGVVPWVQNSNETIHHGKITKRGPEELRTALVQIVMGFRRCKKTTQCFRLMEQYELMRKNKGSGKSIIAAARKLSVIIWRMLRDNEPFNPALMTDTTLGKKVVSMRTSAFANE
jgi:transposase